MLQACKAATGVQNPTAQAWRHFALFYVATGQHRSSKELALKWLRAAQPRGWHEDSDAASEVADCAELLARCAARSHFSHFTKTMPGTSSCCS